MKNLHAIDRKFLEEQSAGITEEDIRRIQPKLKEIRRKFERQAPLKRFFEDAKLLILLLQEYHSGNYRTVPWWAISAVVFALLYVFNPMDIIPEFIPVLGYIDDAAVVALCLSFIEEELVKFQFWKLRHQ